MMDIAEIRKKAQREREGRREEPQAAQSPVTPSAPPLEETDDGHYDESFPQDEIIQASFAPPVVRDPLTVILEGRKSALVDEVLPVEDDADLPVQASSSLEILCFRVADEIYGIDIMELKEIIKPRETTEVPHAPPFIAGVLSLRGIIIPVFALRERLGLCREEGGGKERIIVVKKGDGLCGILVDEVTQVVRIAADTVEQPPAVLDGIDREFVSGIGRHDGKIVIMLAMEKVLDVLLL
ncbi:CheW protein [Geobacter metallireducens RCH3]|uniref:Scaffold protein CheW associated with MCPs of class 40H n=1 Tax=Geobacter metallireducens (strain ATCC 53774 / DSM 7210 / GS-15) TaxID=269799 RepID=Q39T90_GEOMG|nr:MULTISPECIES: chemotaxis protein CheW [Geobacter]ABB32534.1 scaffold protein CheW associated with MCPs of class 40H [Geobacter metallireducens GS-15]EHP86439.1 CheW protein [Geobacter metallireducens RCH3]MBT1076021.1 chemotaxis protein CheW [Geobacter grbiciae]